MFVSRFKPGLCAALALGSIAAGAQTYTATVYPIEPYAYNFGQGIGGGQVVGGGWNGTNVGLLWNVDFAGYTELTFPGAHGAYVYATDGVQQVGYATYASGYSFACLWSGTSASAFSLHPAGASSSFAMAIDGGRQGGFYFINDGDRERPIAWQGTAASSQDLTPDGQFGGGVTSIRGNQAGGYTYPGSDWMGHAALWDLAASTYTDLHPSSYVASYIYAIDGAQQAGYVFPDFQASHAALWSGAPESVVDLHPEHDTAYYSAALSARNGKQVGYVYYSDSGFKSGCLVGNRGQHDRPSTVSAS